MANNTNSGTAYIDSTGALTSKRTKVTYLIYHGALAGDGITLRDGTGGTDPIKLKIHTDAANKTSFFDFSRRPIIFQNGVYCSAISANGSCTLALSDASE